MPSPSRPSDFTYKFPASEYASQNSCIFQLSTGNTLSDVLHPEKKMFLEGKRPYTAGIAYTSPDLCPDFIITLTTQSAYYHNAAYPIVEHLHERFGLSDSKHMQIVTCVQEACINAIVHGNLEIARQPLNMEEFDAHYALIEKRLAQKPYKNRHITVTAWNNEDCLILSVSDQGSGFSLIAACPEDPLPFGRGLFLIKSFADRVWIGDDKRSLFMSFNYPL